MTVAEADLPGLTARVLWAALALGAAFGAIAQRTQFCTMGALADVFGSGDFSRVRMWALAAGSAIVGFNAMVALGWVQASDSLYAAPRLLWASHAVGGLMFGFGMVLASGCGSKTLVRLGGGNLKSLVVALVLGLSALATMRGITAALRVAALDALALPLPAGQDLPSLLAHAGWGDRRALALALGLAVGGALVAWSVARAEGRRGEVVAGGLGIGAVIVAAWWVSGVMGHLEEHPLTLREAFLATNSQRMESLSFVAPVGYALDWLLMFSDRNTVLTAGIAAMAGVVAGSAAAARATGQFRWEGFAGVEDTANHVAGAALMGIGGVTALGCTIGQGLSGLSTLSLGSVVALAGIVAGGWAGLHWQAWRVERMA